MTHVSLAPRARPNAVIAALTALNSSPNAAIADPKATTAVPPRDLSGTHKALNLEGYPGAVCVLVPKLSPDEMAAAKKRFNFDTGGNSYGLGIGVNDKGFGKSHTGRSATSRDINGLLREAHHGVQVGITDVPVRTEGRDRAMHHVH